MMVLDLVNITLRKLRYLPNLKRHKSTLEADSPTDQKALQMLDKLAQLAQELMNNLTNSETMLRDSLSGKNAQRKLEKELVPANTLLREPKV